MVNTDILNELKAALAKGESLKQAMIGLKKSLIEKNYTEEEIEEAARVLQKQAIKDLQGKKPKIKLSKKQIITILEGIKGALARRESLRQAMFSFYNAGYKKEEIEEAARALQRDEQIQPIQRKPQPIKQKIPKPKTIQRVSSYPSHPVEKPFSKRKISLILLIILLVLLLGALVSIFLFKEQVLTFFENSKFFSSFFD